MVYFDLIRLLPVKKTALRMGARVLKIHPADNVIVALRDLPAGDHIDFDGQRYELPYGVSAKHKFVTEDRQPGEPITMYGVRVGKATQPIQRGSPSRRSI